MNPIDVTINKGAESFEGDWQNLSLEARAKTNRAEFALGGIRYSLEEAMKLPAELGMQLVAITITAALVFINTAREKETSSAKVQPSAQDY